MSLVHRVLPVTKPIVTKVCIPLIALVACATGCGGSAIRYCADAEAGASALPNLVYDIPIGQSVVEVPPAQMPEVVQGAYRLKPDRRFLLAIAEIDCLMSHEAFGELRVTYGDGKWTIHYRDELVGDLPEVPDYPDAAGLLEGWIEQLAQRYPLEFRASQPKDIEAIRDRLNEFEVVSVAEALVEVEKRWGNSRRGQELLALASSGLVRMTLQSLDWLEFDRLPAKALAATMMARTLTPVDVSREEALLAYQMGYAVHARQVAESLPDGDPVRLYVWDSVAELRAVAEEQDADPLTRYLYLLRLSDGDDEEVWRSWWEAHGIGSNQSLSTLKHRVRLWSFSSGTSVPRLVTRSALAELWQATQGGHASSRFVSGADDPDVLDEIPTFVDVPPSALVTIFEDSVAGLRAKYPGAILDAETYRSYFAGHFYSAIYQEGVHVLDRQAHVPSAERFLENLEGAPAGTGADMYRWYRHITESEGGRENNAELQADLSQLNLGETMLDRTLDQLRERMGREEFTEAAAAYARRLDTRPSHQSSLAAIAGPNLLDVRTGDKYYQSLLAMAGPDYPRTSIWFARYNGDYRTVLAAVADTTLAAATRKRALELVVESDLVNTEAIKRNALALIRDHPDDYSIRRTFIDFLEEEQDYREALPVLEGWLKEHDRSAGFDYINASNALARFHYHLGEYQTALGYVAPVVNSWQAGAVGRATLVLGAMGRLEEARRLADLLVPRYPNSAWGRSVLTEILWRQGHYDEVIPVLQPDGYQVWATDWEEHVARAFVAVFGNKPVSEAEAAFQTLLDGGVPPHVLDDLTAGVFAAGRPDLAFALQSRLPTDNTRYSLRYPMVAYRYLKAWRGDQAAALRWLQSRVRPAQNTIAFEIFSLGEDELLWDLITQPERQRYAESVWLTRAAAFVRSGSRSSRQRRALLQHYRQESRDPYFTMGRYVMGLENHETMLALATDAHRRCEVAFYMGIRAQGEGRYGDANDWYLVVRATQSTRDYEYRWATDILDEWDDRDRSLAVLARERHR